MLHTLHTSMPTLTKSGSTNVFANGKENSICTIGYYDDLGSRSGRSLSMSSSSNWKIKTLIPLQPLALTTEASSGFAVHCWVATRTRRPFLVSPVSKSVAIPRAGILGTLSPLLPRRLGRVPAQFSAPTLRNAKQDLFFLILYKILAMVMVMMMIRNYLSDSLQRKNLIQRCRIVWGVEAKW